jgi:hypothetical protein
MHAHSMRTCWFIATGMDNTTSNSLDTWNDGTNIESLRVWGLCRQFHSATRKESVCVGVDREGCRANLQATHARVSVYHRYKFII